MADSAQVGVFEGLGSRERGSHERDDETLHARKRFFNHSAFSDNSIIVYQTSW